MTGITSAYKPKSCIISLSANSFDKSSSMKKQNVYIIPVGGLCNRMRAISTGIAIAKKQGLKSVVYWNNCQGLKADFSDLFLPIDDNEIKIVENRKWIFNIDGTKDYLKRWLPLQCLYKPTYNYNIYNNDEKALEISPTKKNLLISCNSMCPDYYDLSSLFTPQKHLQNRIEHTVAEFTYKTYGVHIRRTDNKESIKRSPIESFIKIIQGEIEKDASSKFYLATDDDSVKQQFMQLFPSHIITCTGDTSRNSLEGMEFAVVDLFCLSRTHKIIGSGYSSYSHIAAELGGIEIEYAEV